MNFLNHGLFYPYEFCFDSGLSERGHDTAAQPEEVKPLASQLDAPFVYQDYLPVQGRQNERFPRYPTMQDDSRYFGPIHRATMQLLQALCQEERQAPSDQPASEQRAIPVTLQSTPPRSWSKPSPRHREMASKCYPALNTTAGLARPEKTAQDETSATTLSNQPRRRKVASGMWHNVHVRLEKVIYRIDDKGVDFRWDRRSVRWVNEEGTA